MPTVPRINDFQKDLVAIRHDIHAHPEIAFEENRTSDIVAARLKEYGCEVHRGLAKTGVVGTLRTSNSPRSIGLRADMDALPIQEKNSFAHASTHAGKMHACGHDGHTTMLLGAARYLAETRNFDGTVHFIFQPAEEGQGGGRVMVEEGLFQKFPCDKVFAMHNLPGLPVGTMAVKAGPLLAASDSWHITVKGRGGHGAMPHQGIDPFVVAAHIVLALQTIGSRNVDPLDSFVVSVGYMKGGDTHNVIPDEVEIGGTARALVPEVQDLIEKRMGEIARNTAAAFGATVDHKYMRRYPPTINNADEVAFAAKVAEEVCGKGKLERNIRPLMAGEDFSFMLQQVPGAMFWLGNGAGEGGCIIHNPHYDFNNEILPYGASFFARLVETYLEKKAA
ncbi:MAG: amidohydrolase [Proteobacteria bacterium]|nr:amidohydrolase [Pseudomonadota bacterium]MBI3496296.1 amidohydrolase [Pseudomonadota bacterium]